MPIYTHDSDCCTFMGTTFVTEGNEILEVDFYFCPGQKTISARYSSEPSDYSSFPAYVAKEGSGTLSIGYKIAQKKGFV